MVQSYTRFHRITIPDIVSWLPVVIMGVFAMVFGGIEASNFASKEGHLLLYLTVIILHTLVTLTLFGVFFHSVNIMRKSPSEATKSALRPMVYKLLPCIVLCCIVFPLQLLSIIATLKIPSLNDRFFASDDPTYPDRIGCKVDVLLKSASFELAQCIATVIEVSFYRINRVTTIGSNHDMSIMQPSSPVGTVMGDTANSTIPMFSKRANGAQVAVSPAVSSFLSIRSIQEVPSPQSDPAASV